MTSLIDRYVRTALRRVPEKQRADIDRELRTSIDDAVDARVDGGEPRETAIRNTLLELGDPDRLADGYADRPQYLIGPDLFPVWRRLMVLLFSTALPIVVVVSVVLRALDDPAIGPLIGDAVGTALTVAVQLAFWTTAVFAVLQRTGVTRATFGRDWTLDDLPEYEPGHTTTGQLAVNLLWPVLLIVALILQHFTFSSVPVLDEDHWSFWWPYFIAVLVLDGVYAVWLYRRAWTHTVTMVNAALAVLFTVPLVWLVSTERFFNPEYVDGLDWGSLDALDWLTSVVLAAAVLTAVWDVLDVAIRAERARRGLPAKVPGTGDQTARTG